MADVFEIHGEELEISKEDVLEAFEETKKSIEDYEFQYRDYHFLEIDGERKPVKKVFRNVEEVREKGEDFGFNTLAAERVLRQLDFDIYNKRLNAPELFRECLQEILLDYEDAKKEPFSGEHRMYNLLKGKGPNLIKHILGENFKDTSNLSVTGSAGRGNWADIPWLAVLHEDETTTTQEGIYVDYLFDTEKERITLKLASGVKKLNDEVGKKEARKQLQQKAASIRGQLEVPGFNEGELEYATSSVGELYGPSTSFYKTYQLDEIPQPEELEDDLVTITKKYKQYIESDLGGSETRYWMLHPGENRKYWDKWKEGDYVAIGGEEVDYSKGNIDDQIEENFPEKSVSYVKSVAHKFVDEMDEGDIVLVCGNKKVLRAAKVTSEFYVEGTGDKHRKDVEWLTKEPVDISDYPEGFYNKATSPQTILEFTEKENIATIESDILESNEYDINDILDNVFKDKNDIAAARQHFVKLFRYIGKIDEYRSLLNTTYSVERRKISANFGAWQLFSIQRSSSGYLSLITVNTKEFDPHEHKFPEFERIAHEFDSGEHYKLIKLEWRPDLFEDYPELEQAWRSAIEFATDNFGNWERAPQQKHHNKEVIEWIRNGFLAKADKEIVSEINNHVLTFADLVITEGLHFPSTMGEEINESVRSALKSGKHIIFTGPPGTGKTKVAKNTAEFIRNQNEAVDDYIFTTATADWTTFDTIGGYHPSKDEDTLEFKPGQFLKCFREEDGRPVNKWLIIDEINRADIDKAFGQLFSVLSNDNVELPFTAENDDGKEGTIQIVSLDKGEDFDYLERSYYVTSNWRLLATMNTYDKSSLYEMSYAFMRRFAFIDVGVPTGEIDDNLIVDYISKWNDLTPEAVREHLDEVATMWKVLNEGKRSIGPAIIKDILSFLKENKGNNGLVNALKLYVLPQLEGMVNQNQKEVLTNLADKLGYERKIEKVAKQRFEIELNTDNE